MANIVVFPTANDIGGNGNGEVLSERYLAAYLSCFIKGTIATAGFVSSGFSLTSSGLNLTLALGTAILRGRVVEVVGSNIFAVTANTTNYITLAIMLSGYNVIGTRLVCNASSIVPVDGIRLWKVVAGASTITTTTDYRPVLIANVNAPSW